MNTGTALPNSPVPERWAAKFFIIWTAQAFSLIGSALVQFALIWWLTRTTGSATVLAMASMVALLPQIFLAPFAGTFVDRWSRRMVMIVADSAIALATVGLIFLFASGKVQIWHVYSLLFVRSLGGAFHYPAMAASTSLMVPQKHLARVAGLNQTLSGLINIIAPPVGALLISILSTQGVLFIDVGTAMLAVIPLLFIAIPQPPRLIAQASQTVKKTSFWQDMREGYVYLIRWPGLFGISILAMVINFLLTPAGSLIPLLVTKEYGGGVVQLGWIDSIFGIGIILGGLVLGAWGGFRKRILTSFLGIIGLGVGVLVVGLAPGNLFSLALIGMFLLGFMQVMANGPLQAIFQIAVDPDKQGRVLSLVGSAATAMSPISLLVAGPVADWLGVRVWYIIGGVACILMTIVGLSIPAIRNIEENRKSSLPERT